MKHVTQVKVLENFQLLLEFNHQEQRIFDVKPYIAGDWFGKLAESEYFNTVKIIGNTVQWFGGQDIAPHELYDLSVQVSNAVGA